MVDRTQRVQREVERTLKNVPAGDAVEVLERVEDKLEQVADNPDHRPGAVVNGFKRSWTWKECVAEFPIVSFMPEETVGLTWNGLRVQALAGVMMHVPSCFRDIYEQHRAALRRKPTLPDRGMETIVALNVGPLES